MNNPHFNSSAEAIHWLGQHGMYGEGGIEYLISNAKNLNKTMELSGEVKKATQYWDQYKKYVILHNTQDMINKLGGDQQYINFLNDLKTIINDYFQYYTILNLSKYFEAPKDQPQITHISGDEVMRRIKADIAHAVEVINRVEREYGSSIEELQILRKDLGKEDVPEVRELWIKYQGDEDKMINKLYSCLYNIYAEVFQQYKTLDLLPADSETLILSGKEGKKILLDNLKKMKEYWVNKNWYEKSADVQAFKKWAKDHGDWDDNWENNIILEGEEKVLSFFIDKLEQKLYPQYSGRKSYEWKSNQGTTASRFREIFEATKRNCHESGYRLTHEKDILMKFSKNEKYIPYYTYDQMRNVYPKADDALAFLDRIEKEQSYRTTFKKKNIEYPTGVTTDRQMYDWLEEQIKKYEKSKNYIENEFEVDFTKYLLIDKSIRAYEKKEDFLRDMDYDENKIRDYLNFEIEKNDYYTAFKKQYSNPNNKTRAEQIKEIRESVKRLNEWKKPELTNEIDKYNKSYGQNDSVEKIILDSEKSNKGYHQWLIFYKIRNKIVEIENITKTKYNEPYTENDEGLKKIEKDLKSAEENNSNFENETMKKVIEDYQKVFHKEISIGYIKDVYKGKYKDALYTLRNIIIREQLATDYGYTADEINKFKEGTEESTYSRLQTEKNRVDAEIKDLKENGEAIKLLDEYTKSSKFKGSMDDLFKQFQHNSKAVIFYLTWYSFNTKNIEKHVSEEEMLVRYHHDYGRGIYDMNVKMALYDRRKDLFEKELKDLMSKNNITYDELMNFDYLKTNNIQQDLENAKAVLSNFDDDTKYQKYLEEVGEEDTAYTNYNTQEKKKYLKQKIKEYDIYKELFENQKIAELFTTYSKNNPGSVLNTWADRYKFTKKNIKDFDPKKIKLFLELDDEKHKYETNYEHPWETTEVSKWKEEEQLNYLKKVNSEKKNYSDNKEIQDAINEYNNAFPTEKIKLQDIVNQWGDNYKGVIRHLLRKARIHEAQELLGNRFDINRYPENENGLQLLKSDIDYEKARQNKFDKDNKILKNQLNEYNEKFTSDEGKRDMVWLKNEFNNSFRKASYGLPIYRYIDKINKLYDKKKYDREKIRQEIIQSTDDGRSILEKLTDEEHVVNEEIRKMGGYANENEFKEALQHWNKQHGTHLNVNKALINLGVFQNSDDKYPRAKKAVAELLLFYRNSLYPTKKIDSSEINYSTNFDTLINKLKYDINNAIAREKLIDQDENINSKLNNLKIDIKERDEIKRKYDDPKDTELHVLLQEQIDKFNDISGNKELKNVDNIKTYSYRSLKKNDLLEYLKAAVKVSYDELSNDFQKYLEESENQSEIEKFKSIDSLQNYFDSAFEAKAHLNLEINRLKYNELSGKNLTMDVLLRNNKYEIAKAKEFLDDNVTYMKYWKAKGKKVYPISDSKNFHKLSKLQQIEKLNEYKAFLNNFEDSMDRKTKENYLMTNKIDLDDLKKYANSENDIPTILKILDSLPEFNKKFGKNITSKNLDQLCSEDNDWNAAYFNVKIMPLIYDWNYIANKMSEPQLFPDDIKNDKIFENKKITVKTVDEAIPIIKKKLLSKKNEFLQPLLDSYNQLAEQKYNSLDEIYKIYPEIDDAERFLRIEKYCSPIRKAIRKMKTMKYEIPTTLELKEDNFSYLNVKKSNNNIDMLEQNLQQQYSQFNDLLKKFQEEDAKTKQERNYINPKIADINRLRSKLGMSSISIDQYKGMDFETVKSALNEELRDLNDRQRQKDNQKSNAVGGGWNSGTSIGGTVGAPMRFSSLLNTRQTNPLSTTTTTTTTNSTTSPLRPGVEVTKSGIGDLSRGNAPFRLTGFPGASTKPESDNLFSTKSIFDKKDDDDKPSFDFTKPLRPTNKFEPPVSIRRWAMDKNRYQRLKSDNYGENNFFNEKSSNEFKIPEIKPLTSPTIITKDNNPIEKIESLGNKKKEDEEINLTFFKMPKNKRKGDLLPIPRDKKATIRTRKGLKKLPKRARKNAPLRTEKVDEKFETKPKIQEIKPLEINEGPSLSDSFEMPKPYLQPRPVEKRETFIPNRNVSKQDVDRKLLEIRKQNKLKNAPMRIQRINNMTPSQNSYSPPIQTNNIPPSILDNPQLSSLLKI